jgi:hypothetical protein
MGPIHHITIVAGANMRGLTSLYAFLNKVNAALLTTGIVRDATWVTLADACRLKYKKCKWLQIYSVRLLVKLQSELINNLPCIIVYGLKISEPHEGKQKTLECVQGFARYRRQGGFSRKSLSEAIIWKCIHWSVESVYRSLPVSWHGFCIWRSDMPVNYVHSKGKFLTVSVCSSHVAYRRHTDLKSKAFGGNFHCFIEMYHLLYTKPTGYHLSVFWSHVTNHSHNYKDIRQMALNTKTGKVRVTWHWGAFRQLLLQWKISKYYILWVCVCSVRYPAFKRMRHTAIRGLSGITTFFHLIW